MDLRAGTRLAPHLEPPAHEFGPLPHPLQTEMSGGRPAPDHLLVNALPIVAHAQPELPRVETDLHRNLPRRSVAIGIAHTFVGDPIHLRADDRLQRPRCAVHDDVDRRSIRPVGGELITNRGERPDEVIFFVEQSQALHGVASVRGGPHSLLQRCLESLLGLPGLLGKESQRSVEQEQDSLKILQQRVVEVTRDAGSLGDTRVQCHLQLSSQLPETQLPGRPQQPREQGGAQRAKPVRLIHRGRNGEIQRRARLVPDTAVIGSHDAEAIGPGRQVGVERLAAIAGFLPVVVCTLPACSGT